MADKKIDRITAIQNPKQKVHPAILEMSREPCTCSHSRIPHLSKTIMVNAEPSAIIIM